MLRHVFMKGAGTKRIEELRDVIFFLLHRAIFKHVLLTMSPDTTGWKTTCARPPACQSVLDWITGNKFLGEATSSDLGHILPAC